MSDSVGVIRDLDCSLSAGAKFSLIDRILRIALQLLRERDLGNPALSVTNHFGIALHHSYADTATGGAQRTNTRLPDGDAGHKPIFRGEADEVIFGISAAREGRAGARECGKFYK